MHNDDMQRRDNNYIMLYVRAYVYKAHMCVCMCVDMQ